MNKLIYKIYVFVVLILSGNLLYAQTYNNEWIKYGQPYYKFEILSDGLYRINGAALSAAGLNNVTGSQLQMWHNGQQIYIYVSNSGTMGSNDYIEFWGQHNDGSTDAQLFKYPSDQLNPGKSFETDSAAYFITVNTNTAQNLHYVDNGVVPIPTSISPESYFMYTVQNSNLGNTLNNGPQVGYSGDYVYSSDYQYKFFGKRISLSSIGASTNASVTFNNLHPYTGSTVSSNLAVGVGGASINGTSRTITVSGTGNGNLINAAPLGAFSGKMFTASNFQVTVNSYTLTVSEANSFNSSSDTLTDYATVGYISLTYPRIFDFGGQSSFAFSLSASTQQRVLQISDFNANSSTPVLYDMTNGQRYTATISGNNFLFTIPAMGASNFVLVGQAAASYANIQGSQIFQKNYTDITSTANQGNYLIIYHKSLLSGAQAYQQFRASAAGGSFNVKLYDIQDLEDEFAFGIRMSPLSVKNFLSYARHKFAQAPQYALLIGRGLAFTNTFGTNQALSSGGDTIYQNLIPTYGWPASDILLASDNFSPVASTPIGRLSAISSAEVNTYLSKIQTYIQSQQSDDNTIDNNSWKKNVAFISGAGNNNEEATFGGYLQTYMNIMKDTLYGANSYYFSNITAGFATQPNAELNALFAAGLPFISYYGHGASTTIGYQQLGSPTNFAFNNKYTIISTSGCDVGNCFDYMASRNVTKNNITERWLFTPNVGSVGFIAQSYLGITNILDLYNQTFYRGLDLTYYGQPITSSMIRSQQALLANPAMASSDSISIAADAAQTNLLGDPAISLFNFALPDFAVEASQIYAPANVAASDNKFTVKAYLYNLGRAVGDSVLVQVQIKLPSGTTQTIVSKNIAAVKVMDSIQVDVPLDPNINTGNNTIIVTIDGDNRYKETTTLNNSASMNVYVYSSGLTPIYPYNYSIIHTQGTHLIASTSNPLAPTANYIMELDTTALFNSPFMITKTVNSIGGAIDFNPGISYTDSMVYYWRVSPMPTTGGAYLWENSSFQYIGSPNTWDGFGQSHLYQHEQSSMQGIYLDSTSRVWNFDTTMGQIQVNNAATGAAPLSNYLVNANGKTISSYYCTAISNSILFTVFTPGLTFYYNNQTQPSPIPTTVLAGVGNGFMGSTAACGSNPYAFDVRPANIIDLGTFQFSYGTTANRNTVAQFMNWIPDGAYVVIRLMVNNSSPLITTWESQDGTGAGSLYNAFMQQGLTAIDSFTTPRVYAFIYRKGGHGFTPTQIMTANLSGQINNVVNVSASSSVGTITSPKFGPAASWHSLQWNGKPSDTANNALVFIIGYDSTGTVATVLDTVRFAPSTNSSFDISNINAKQYPYLQLQMRNADSIYYTPYQMRYWHLLYTPKPEGALAANIIYTSKDTIVNGEDYHMTIAFKNVSDQPFTDSIVSQITLTAANNAVYTIPVPKLKPLQPGDTAILNITIPGDTIAFNQANPLFPVHISTKNLLGANTMYLMVNPNYAQPEVTLVNNFLYHSFYVQSVTFNGNMDVTFDGIHILNNDIVSAKPTIVIHLNSDSKYVLLNDTTVATVSLKFPDGTIHNYYFNTDTLQFTPAKDSSENEAILNFLPNLTQDGTYQLIITGGGANSETQNLSYTVSFQIYSKPMISDLFNYPNPFTSSTAFVFTITGNEVPQNLRIEVLTITGKIVKEITKAELGPLHVGNNITEYRWDGTDMYGQKLANGVYLYRVITNENGKSLDHFDVTDQSGNSVNTGQYFKKGYGKMYLMR